MTVYKKNNKYYCRFQIDGERHHYLCSGATSVKEAEKIENALKYKLIQQQNGLLSREQKAVRLKTLIALYQESDRINNLSCGKTPYTKYIAQYFGENTNVKEITAERVEKFKVWLQQERKSSNATINKYRAALSKCFNLGIANKLITENPVRDTKALREGNHKIRFLTVEEERRLFEVIDKQAKHLKPLVITALQTGMRRGEILNLKWSNVDLEFGFIELLKTKSGRSRRIPISDKLRKVLEGIERTSEFVFINSETGCPYTDIKHSWSSVLKEAKIDNFRFHDLRHTFCTRLADSGVPIPIIQELAGHSRIATTMRYTHVIPEQKKKAIELLNSYN